MIIEFSVKNYRSIKDLQTLSMVAAPIKSKYPELDANNIIPVSDKFSLLKSVAIYGANGSGKSNLVRALRTMLILINESFKNESLGIILVEPFFLNLQSFKEPTFFQLIFICDEVRYRYGFEMLNGEIKSEWLFGTPDKKEVYFFTRADSNIQINEKQFSEGKGLLDKTSKSNLFLNITKAFNGKISNLITNYLSKTISISGGISDNEFRERTKLLIKNELLKNQIIALMNHADFGIQDIFERSFKPEDLDENSYTSKLKNIYGENFDSISTKRIIYNQEGKVLFENNWTMYFNESEGTLKFFNYSGVVIDALNNGTALILDEFDARLHPMLTKKLVEMFNSPTINRNGAQLVFVTYDTNLLDNSLLRRDQIYFTEKNKMQETVLYSLADFKGVRNDASYEKDYINGKYGAIPFLGDFEKLFQ
ncbi:MAG TPA: hypothetical protein DCR40_10615 [Prolixibacteraceae bacterium]|nr:hypothetical protein [Prolixibacteraceae bacterium]